MFFICIFSPEVSVSIPNEARLITLSNGDILSMAEQARLRSYHEIYRMFERYCEVRKIYFEIMNIRPLRRKPSRQGWVLNWILRSLSERMLLGTPHAWKSCKSVILLNILFKILFVRLSVRNKSWECSVLTSSEQMRWRFSFYCIHAFQHI